MKQNNVILWVMLTLFVASCSKAPELQPTEESTEGKALLSFSVDGFAQENLPFPKSPNLLSSIKPLSADAGANAEFNLRDHVNTIDYIIYRYGTRVDSLRQYASDPNFGKYSKYVPASTDTTSNQQQYHINVVAAMLEDGQAMRYKGTATTVEVGFPAGMPDAFFYYAGGYLPEGRKHTSVQMRRMSGRVEVIPTDTIPANAARVEIEVSNVARNFFLKKQEGYFSLANASDGTGSELKVVNIQPEDIGKKEKTFSSYFLLKETLGTTAAPRTVTITAYDKNNKVMIQRVVRNVNLQANQITRLRGPVFSNHPNVDFSVELESDWKTDIPEFIF